MKGLDIKSLTVAAGMLLVAGQAATPAAVAAKATVRAPTVARDEKRRRLDGAGASAVTSAVKVRKRDGWSVAQDRRNAAKARNVRRNRAAHR